MSQVSSLSSAAIRGKRTATSSFSQESGTPARVAPARVITRRTTAATTATATAVSRKKSSKRSAACVDSCQNDATDESTEEVKCAICEQKVIEGEEQALFCEGVCNQWVHRYCAGVSTSLFKQLSLSTTSFYCYACSQTQHASEIAMLSESITLLKKEIADLRDKVNVAHMTRSAHMTTSTTERSTVSETTVKNSHGDGKNYHVDTNQSNTGDGNTRGGRSGGVRGGRGGGCGRGGGRRCDRGGRGGSGRGGAGGWGGWGEGGTGRENSNHQQAIRTERDDKPILNGRKMKVTGARRVWGTLSVCTSAVVKSVIERCCGIKSIRVRRKTSVRGGQHWWFVLHDHENVLCSLEAKWDLIKMQTSWKLEPCYKPDVQLQDCQEPIVCRDNATNDIVYSDNVTDCVGDNGQQTSVSLDAVTMVDETSPTQDQTQNVNETLHDCANVQLNRIQAIQVTQTSPPNNASPQGED